MSINIQITDLADFIYSFKVLYESPRRKPGWRFTAGVHFRAGTRLTVYRPLQYFELL